MKRVFISDGLKLNTGENMFENQNATHQDNLVTSEQNFLGLDGGIDNYSYIALKTFTESLIQRGLNSSSSVRIDFKVSFLFKNDWHSEKATVVISLEEGSGELSVFQSEVARQYNHDPFYYTHLHRFILSQTGNLFIFDSAEPPKFAVTIRPPL